MKAFQPYVAPEMSMREFSLRSIILGILFGILFGTANAYLGLRVGLTISTSIPIAVIAVAVFRVLKNAWAPATILETNMTQTIGSASSSLASGIIFTIPALFLWGLSPSIAQIGMLALLGGLLGVLFMIPLRRFLIVREHATLPYPEGTAAGHVLIAADSGGTKARNIFYGMGIAAAYKAILSFLKLVPGEVSIRVPILKKAVIGMETSPALLGVGFILNYRIASIMVAGGLLSWLVLIPLIATFGQGLSSPFFPEMTDPIAAMSSDQIWTRYIRYIGAGAVAFAGIVTVIKSLPTMYAAARMGFHELTRRTSAKAGRVRTDHDLPMSVVFIGALCIVLAIAVLPHVIGESNTALVRVLGALCIGFFAFLFVTVSSRIVGMVGVTSNPTSGMTIVTLLGTSIVFAMLGWTDITGMAAALTVGTVVAVAASIAGDTSQDLKTGYIVGATPSRQQTGELIGVLTSAFFIAAAVWLLGETFGFGTEELPAPQAMLMKTVVEGVLQANLPWGLVFIGAGLALVAELLGIKPLAFAVGIYLPLSTMVPVFLGGVIRRIVDHHSRDDEALLESRRDQGVLFSSGLIAGEGLLGVAIAFYAFFYGKPSGLGIDWPGHMGEIVSFLLFMGLGFYLLRMAYGKWRR